MVFATRLLLSFVGLSTLHLDLEEIGQNVEKLITIMRQSNHMTLLYTLKILADD